MRFRVKEIFYYFFPFFIPVYLVRIPEDFFLQIEHPAFSYVYYCHSGFLFEDVFPVCIPDRTEVTGRQGFISLPSRCLSVLAADDQCRDRLRSRTR
jgi:hypothetical protein